MNTLTVYRLGRVEYEDGLQLMKLFGEARRQGLYDRLGVLRRNDFGPGHHPIRDRQGGMSIRGTLKPILRSVDILGVSQSA